MKRFFPQDTVNFINFVNFVNFGRCLANLPLCGARGLLS